MMKAVRLHAIGDLRCDRVEIPKPRGSEVLIKVGACGICGSDLPRVFEHGTSSGVYPLTIGHEFAGEVAAVGTGADPGLVGRRGAVFPLIPCGSFAQCEHYDYLGSRRDGGFAEYCLLPSQWHLVQSEGASMEALAMTEPACVAQHAVRRTGAAAGSFIVIFGAGPIGMMAARWARIFGCVPMLADVAAHKVEFARSKGFAAADTTKEDVLEAVLKYNRGRLADAAIEGSGAGEALEACIKCLRPRGTAALLGNPSGDALLSKEAHGMIMRRELTVLGVWNSSRAPWPVDEWRYTVSMLDSGRLHVEDLISDRLSLEGLPGAIGEIRRGERRVMKAVCL